MRESAHNHMQQNRNNFPCFLFSFFLFFASVFSFFSFLVLPLFSAFLSPSSSFTPPTAHFPEGVVVVLWLSQQDTSDKLELQGPR